LFETAHSRFLLVSDIIRKQSWDECIPELTPRAEAIVWVQAKKQALHVSRGYDESLAAMSVFNYMLSYSGIGYIESMADLRSVYLGADTRIKMPRWKYRQTLQ